MRYEIEITSHEESDLLRDIILSKDPSANFVPNRNGRFSLQTSLSLDEVNGIEFVKVAKHVPRNSCWFPPYIPAIFTRTIDTPEETSKKIDEQLSRFKLNEKLLRTPSTMIDSDTQKEVKIPKCVVEEYYIQVPKTRVLLPQGFRWLEVGEVIERSDWIVFDNEIASAKTCYLVEDGAPRRVRDGFNAPKWIREI